MKITTKLRYGMRMLVLMAEKGGLISTNELARQLQVSPLYLRQIAVELERRGIISSVRGAKGGYVLARDPSEITAEEIAEIYEDMNIVPCIEDPDSCIFSSTCKTRKLWMKLNRCMREFLRNVKLEQIARGEKKSA